MKHIDDQVRFVAALAAGALALLLPLQSAHGQSREQKKDSVVVQASNKYEAGGFQRWLLGNTWRDVWATPIKVEVLDLKTFAGGLTPTEKGGNHQTTSLRFMGRDGVEYQFRPVYKDRLAAIEAFEHTVIASVFRDGLSSLHPTAPLAVPPILDATGIVHPTPRLYIMPNEEALGEFRKEFAGKLGAIEERALMPKEGLGLGGAAEIIDSDALLERLNKDPSQRVDERAFLTARLIDVFVNDNDRHRYQWRWAHIPPKLAGSTAGDDLLWVPIPRDRDAVFVNHDGVLLKAARYVQRNLVTFDANYPKVAYQQTAALELDQRLLIGLNRATWDSVVVWLKMKITNAVIDSAMARMPKEYAASSAEIAAKLRSRRDKLHEAASEYYRFLALIPEIHAPDSDDRVTITRENADVIVQIQTGERAPWFERRFVAGETRELRVYLHGGADKAVVRGDGNEGIFLRVIGGNGNNTLIDSSTVNGRHRLTRLYDNGSVDDIEYGTDTTFNRRPWIKAYGKQIPPVKDRGWRTGPTFHVGSGAGLGIVAKMGFERKHYGFRYVPFKSRTSLDLEYATGVNGFRAAFESDRRVESSQLHYMFDAEATQLNMVEFRGFGNTVEDSDDLFFDVKQLQLIARPSIGVALGPLGDLSLGPIVKYVVADSIQNRFISEALPLGFPRFGQAGGQLVLKQDTRDTAWTRGVFVRASASYYPQVWDVKNPFGEVSALASTYFTIPILTRPTLALRGGAKKVFGDFPYYESAFVGGRTSLRAMHRQRFAGDASLHGTTELRVPLARVNYILPWSFGAIGFMEAGRVYVNGESPGTWHSARGYGGWIGLLGPKTAVHIVRTNRAERRIVVGIGLAF